VSCGVLIVDDNEQFLGAARVLLEGEGMRVVGVASTAAEALRQADELRPDVVLVDIMLAHESGFELTRRLRAHDPACKTATILISMHTEADFVDLIDDCAASGFVPKSQLSAKAIRRIIDANAF
jgi:DNA-binding NarL/FixJ family response regulator